MSDRLPRVNGFEVRAALQRAGWTQTRQVGSHAVLRHPTRMGRVVIAMHREDMSPGTLHSIIRDAGLTVSEFNALR